MNSRKIIAEAWEFTRDNKRLMWWFSFFPSLLSLIVSIIYVTYQFFAFKRSALFDNAHTSFLVEAATGIITFLNTHSGLWIPAILITVVVGLLYFLLPTICQAGMIRYIARHRTGEQVRLSSALSFGILIFLPLLEYHLLVKSFSYISIFGEAGFVVRNLGVDVMETFLPIFIIVLVFGFFLTLLFTYSDFFIVLEKKSVVESMTASAKLVILSWKHTFIIGILMLIIGMRIIINVVIVLLIPLLLFVLGGYVASVTFAAIGIYLGIFLGFIALFLSAYFSAILNVFANAVWTYTFLHLRGEKDIQEEIS